MNGRPTVDLATTLGFVGEELEKQILGAARDGIERWIHDFGVPLDVDVDIILKGFMVLRGVDPPPPPPEPRRKRSPPRPAGGRSTREAVREALAAGATTVADVYELVREEGMDRQQVRSALSRLAAQGEVARTGESGSFRYSIPSE